MNPGGGSLCLFPGSWILLRRTDVFIQYHTMRCDGCTSYLGEIGTDYILKKLYRQAHWHYRVHRRVYAGHNCR